MGEMAEYYLDMALASHLIFDEFDDRPRPGKGEWGTKEKGIVKIKHMETSHIQNCMRLLERRGRKDCDKYKEFEQELFRRK